ncbi:hypothetical protein QWE_11246 [Agrobacterium albertimagni AOL15]|uniref:Polysaccharide chain length determinant N-terminal domain-containing protein n=1 Tax=Agrobacterium albertimagni AOL15 TaxID=1156935 RepID=K2Q2K2_9HYPH|nr:hypothetical protein [Agrobacterium albertimagni]EKF59370.1 hypothetical protein QWE_11246 [Agrobacterium albertimagni AOL15]
MVEDIRPEKQVEAIDLLDLAVFVARYWVILIFVPLVAAAIVYLMSSTTSSPYTANTRFQVPHFVANDIVDNAVALIFQDEPSDGVTVNVSERVISISTLSPTREEAISVIRKERSRIAEALKTAIDVYAELLERQKELLEQLVADDGRSAETILEVIKLTSHVKNQSQRLSAAQAWTNNISTQQIEASSTARPLIHGIAAGALTGLIALIFAVVRTTISHLRQDPKSSAKLDQVRHAFLMKRT